MTFDSNDPNIYVDVTEGTYLTQDDLYEWLKSNPIEYTVTTVYPDIYDPNDEIYSYLPEPPGHWKEKYGDVERTRLIHALSEQRIAIALQGKRLKELEDYIATKEWENEMP